MKEDSISPVLCYSRMCPVFVFCLFCLKHGIWGLVENGTGNDGGFLESWTDSPREERSAATVMVSTLKHRDPHREDASHQTEVIKMADSTGNGWFTATPMPSKMSAAQEHGVDKVRSSTKSEHLKSHHLNEERQSEKSQTFLVTNANGVKLQRSPVPEHFREDSKTKGRAPIHSSSKDLKTMSRLTKTISGTSTAPKTTRFSTAKITTPVIGQRLGLETMAQNTRRPTNVKMDSNGRKLGSNPPRLSEMSKKQASDRKESLETLRRRTSATTTHPLLEQLLHSITSKSSDRMISPQSSRGFLTTKILPAIPYTLTVREMQGASEKTTRKIQTKVLQRAEKPMADTPSAITDVPQTLPIEQADSKWRTTSEVAQVFTGNTKFTNLQLPSKGHPHGEEKDRDLFVGKDLPPFPSSPHESSLPLPSGEGSTAKTERNMTTVSTGSINSPVVTVSVIEQGDLGKTLSQPSYFTSSRVSLLTNEWRFQTRPTTDSEIFRTRTRPTLTNKLREIGTLLGNNVSTVSYHNLMRKTKTLQVGRPTKAGLISNRRAPTTSTKFTASSINFMKMDKSSKVTVPSLAMKSLDSLHVEGGFPPPMKPSEEPSTLKPSAPLPATKVDVTYRSTGSSADASKWMKKKSHDGISSPHKSASSATNIPLISPLSVDLVESQSMIPTQSSISQETRKKVPSEKPLEHDKPVIEMVSRTSSTVSRSYAYSHSDSFVWTTDPGRVMSELTTSFRNVTQAMSTAYPDQDIRTAVKPNDLPPSITSTATALNGKMNIFRFV
uniref:uncharacterized protein n=1 Tax=Myxine glutinosa TaxID=7769 RepID=UPI00358F9864